MFYCWKWLCVLVTCSFAPLTLVAPVRLPPEVIVSSHASLVKGSDREGQVLKGFKSSTSAGQIDTAIDTKAAPVVIGVRVHETKEQRNEPMWRNARVIEGKLFPNVETGFDHTNYSPPAAANRLPPELLLQAGVRVAKGLRTGRILNIEKDSEAEDSSSARTTLPPYYYRKYYQAYKADAEKRQSSETSDHFRVTGESSIRPSKGSRNGASKNNRVGNNTPRNPTVYKAFYDADLNAYANTDINQDKTGMKNEFFTLSNAIEGASDLITADYEKSAVKALKDNFKHRVQYTPQHQHQQQHGSIRFPGDYQLNSANQVLASGSYGLPQAAIDFQNSVDPFSGQPADPNQFKIKQMSFQSVPGGPIVNIPVPIPHDQQTKPLSGFSLSQALGLDGLFGGNRRKDRYSAQQQQQQLLQGQHSSPQGYSQLVEYESEPSVSLYDTLTAPVRRLGEFVIELARPFRESAEQLALGDSYQQQQLDNKQGVIAGPEEALLVGGVVAGAGVLAGVGAAIYFNTVTNDTHYIIGRRRRRRSLYFGVQHELADNLAGSLDPVQLEFLRSIEGADASDWYSESCAKRMFCDFMVLRDQKTVESLLKRVTTFLSYLDTGESGGLMDQARAIREAILHGSCSQFHCSSSRQSSKNNVIKSQE